MCHVKLCVETTYDFTCLSGLSGRLSSSSLGRTACVLCRMLGAAGEVRWADISRSLRTPAMGLRTLVQFQLTTDPLLISYAYLLVLQLVSWYNLLFSCSVTICCCHLFSCCAVRLGSMLPL